MKQPVIKTDSLTKYCGKSRGILELNLTVEEGDFFGFIGPNGAGKSTTIRTLLGLTSPTSGSAWIFGKDIVRHKEYILRDVGYMPSEAAFYPSMKVRDVIQFSASLRKQDCRAEAARLCERLQLDTSRRISQLSLGNRKKVAIVCALQHRPALCILDEPTSGLDPLMQQEFFAILKERNEEGASIFLSSHVLSEVQKYCRHAAVIREGRLLLSDTMEHLGHTEAKRVILHGTNHVPKLPQNHVSETVTANNTAQLRDIHVNSDSVSFLYSGPPNVLLTVLSEHSLTDLTIQEPSLDELFMHYYQKEENYDHH